MENNFNPADKVVYIKSNQEMIIEYLIKNPAFTGQYMCYWIDPVAGEKQRMSVEEKDLVSVNQ